MPADVRSCAVNRLCRLEEISSRPGRSRHEGQSALFAFYAGGPRGETCPTIPQSRLGFFRRLFDFAGPGWREFHQGHRQIVTVDVLLQMTKLGEPMLRLGRR